MRNILQYPVTKEELISFLNEELEKYKNMPVGIGDMTGMYYREMIKIVSQSDYKMVLDVTEPQKNSNEA
jgi:hypothetical protein